MIQTIKATLTSDSSGDATATVDVNGLLKGVEIKNGTGTSQPTDQWDLTLDNEQGTELFADTGIGQTSNEFNIPSLAGTAGTSEYPYPVSGTLTLTGANMGDTKTAWVILYVEGA